jgi:LEM3-like protein
MAKTRKRSRRYKPRDKGLETSIELVHCSVRTATFIRDARDGTAKRRKPGGAPSAGFSRYPERPSCARSWPPGFYVYELLDPRTGLPFYVGKGQRDRAWQHEANFRAGRPCGNTRKNDVIAEILLSGQSVQVRIVKVFQSEVDALDLEYLMVEENPTLTNMRQGGDGRSPLSIERRREAYLKARADLLGQIFEADRKKFHALRGSEHYREKINEWVDSLKDKAFEAAKLTVR